MTRAAVLIIGAALGLAGCGGPPNSLEGSIGESFPLDFDRVRVRKQDEHLLIEYLKDLGGTTHKMLKIVIDTDDLNLGDGTEITDEAFLEHVVIQRHAAEGGDFPEVKSGAIRFRELGFDAGDRVDGDFDALLVNGRTLNGNFDAELIIVDTS